MHNTQLSAFIDGYAVTYSFKDRIYLTGIVEINCKGSKIQSTRRIIRLQEPDTWSLVRDFVLKLHGINPTTGKPLKLAS